MQAIINMKSILTNKRKTKNVGVKREKLPPEVRYWPTSPHLKLGTVLGAISQEQRGVGNSISTVGVVMAPSAGR